MNDDRQAKMLEKVRALLAKAESTTFPEEADSFRAKADELMTAYAIDQFMVEQAQAGRDVRAEPVRREFDRSWAGSKFRWDLLQMFGAVARHCRCVVGTRGTDYAKGKVPVYGLPSDLDYLDMLYTSLSLEVAKNLQPSIDRQSSLGANVYRLRQAGTTWPEITRKAFEAGMVELTKGEHDKQLNRSWHRGEDREPNEWQWSELIGVVRESIKNRLANANRKYVKDNGLQGERNYVHPEVYQRSFMFGFTREVGRRLRSMEQASRSSYDAGHEAGSMALAVRDIREQALALYEQEFPPPPPVEPDPNRKPTKLPALREVTIDYGAVSKGAVAARNADLHNAPARRMGARKNLPS